MEKKENKFIDNYFNDYNKLLLSNFDEVKKKLILIKKNFLQIKKNKKKNNNIWKWWKCSNLKSF